MTTSLTEAMRDLVRAIAKQHQVSQSPTPASQPCYWVAGAFVASESFDTDLSEVTVAGTTVRSVPRLTSAWTIAPSPGTSLGMLQIGQAYIILSTLSGNPLSSPWVGAGG